MKMKGHTMIELTDVNTGEKEVHQDDNLVTNALSWLLNKSCGIFCNNPVASAIGPGDALVKACTGGVFLFKEPLEEDVDTIHVPEGAELVGCGSGIPYTGALDLAGSYNAIESGFSDDGMSYKHVWDFNTSQANGKISCVCLTTQAGGKVTPGVPYFDEGYKLDGEAMFVVGTKQVQPPKNENGQSTSYSLLWFDPDGGRLFIDRSNYDARALTTTMVIDKYRASFHNAFSLWESTFGDHGDNLEGTVSVEMPQGLIDAVNADAGGYYCHKKFTVGNEVHVFLKRGRSDLYRINEGERISVWRVDMETLECGYVTVENKLPTNIYFSNSNATMNLLSFGDYLFVIGVDMKMYRVNTLDPSDYSTVKLQDGSDLSMVDAYFRNPCCHAGRLLFSYGNFTCSVDPQSCVASFRNEKVERTRFSCGDYLVSDYMIPYVDPCVLVTVNNLQTPVVKTASQSMKVTYTIGFGEG